jgi:hypothetical protein
MRSQRLAAQLRVGLTAVFLVAGCASGATPTPSPTPVPSFPPELTGIWAGDWLYMGKVVGETAYTIHPCAVSGTGPVDVGCGHADFRTPESATLFQGCIQTLTFVGMERDAFAFQERTIYDWGNERCAEGRDLLTPMLDGTLDVKHSLGPTATLHRVGASPAP